MCLGFTFNAVSQTVVAQTVETVPFRVRLTPNQGVPPSRLPADGTVTMWVRVVRDAAGKAVSASADLSVQYSITFAHGTRTLKLYRGTAPNLAELFVDTGVLPRDVLSGGTWYFERKALPLLPRQAELLLANPGTFYLSLELSLETGGQGQPESKPDGALEGPLVPADQVVLLARLAGTNPVPPVPAGVAATGVGAVHLIACRDRRGQLTSAEVLLDIDSDGLPGDTLITSLQLLADSGDSIRVDRSSQYFETGFPVQTESNGRIRYRLEVQVNQTTANIVTAMLRAPATLSLIVNTRDQPNGGLRGRLHGTGRVNFVVPSPTGLAIDTLSLSLHSLRDQTGKAIAALAIFDPGQERNTVFVEGLDRARLFESPLVRDMPPYNTVNFRTAADLASVNALLVAPETFRVTFNAMSPVRLAPSTGPPVAQSVISAVWDPQHRPIAPGGLFTVFGRNLTSVAGDLAGLLGNRIPTALNGTSILMAGRAVPILDVQADHIIAQVPVDMPIGWQTLMVRTPNGDSAVIPAIVTATAPAVFFSSSTAQGHVAAVYKANGTVVSMENPARPNDVLLFFSSGFGARTTPAMVTGTTAPESPFQRTVNPMVSIGGRPAAVLYSVLAPSLVGIVQTAVRMPQSAGSGNIPLVVNVGGVLANPVILFAALR